MRCVIVGGAEINNYDYINRYLKEDDFGIFCDCGLTHLDKLKIKADLIVGDFDSFKQPEDINTEIIVLPREKDDTDTVYAVKEAIKRGFDDFIIIGALGNRFDHSLGNISILEYLHNINIKAVIIDDYSEIMVVADETIKISDEYSFFSLINIFGKASGIYIKNAKYPLENAEITTEYQYGISNEVIKNKEAEVFVKNGKLLLIKVK